MEEVLEPMRAVERDTALLLQPKKGTVDFILSCKDFERVDVGADGFVGGRRGVQGRKRRFGLSG